MTGFQRQRNRNYDYLMTMSGEADQETCERTKAMLADPNSSWNRERAKSLRRAKSLSVPFWRLVHCTLEWCFARLCLRKIPITVGAIVLLLVGIFARGGEGQADHMRRHIQLTIKNYAQLGLSMNELRKRHSSAQLSTEEFELESARISGSIQGELSRLTELPSLEVVHNGDAATFVEDGETFPDGSIVKVGEVFEKVWLIRNSGRVPWINRRILRSGDASAPGEVKSDSKTAIPDTLPGMTCRISMVLTAPDKPGGYYAEWKMVDEKGRYLLPGQLPIYVLIYVTDSE